MTLPIPSVKYNLLRDINSPRHGKEYCFSIILLCVLIIPVFLVFIINFYFLYSNDPNEPEDFLNRAELYSLDEYLHKASPCKLCENSPSEKPSEENPNTPLKMVCYYNFPESLEDPKALMPENIECNLCTHINLAFAEIHNNSIVISQEGQNVTKRVMSLKKCNKDLKVLLSIGGANADNGFPEMVVTHATRKEFIKSLKATLQEYSLDGVDLDWEFPGVESLLGKESEARDKRQRQHFSQLLREVRTEFIREKRDYLLTVAVAAPENIVQAAYDVMELNQYVDFVNIMSYDFHFYTKYTPFTGFNAPLYPMDRDNFYLSSLNINYTAHMWLSKGMDRNKIVIGLPTYGHSFALVNSNNGSPGSPARGYGKLGSLGFVVYSDVCNFINSTPDIEIVFVNQTLSPYLHKDYEWISYENDASISAKGKYVKDIRFGGAMVYSLNTDDYTGQCPLSSGTKFPLISKLSNIILDNDL